MKSWGIRKVGWSKNWNSNVFEMVKIIAKDTYVKKIEMKDDGSSTQKSLNNNNEAVLTQDHRFPLLSLN